MQTFDARSGDQVVLDTDAGAAAANPLVLAHRLLRGRYAWAAGLGVALGAPLAWLGYTSKQPMFTSEGVVEILPTQ